MKQFNTPNDLKEYCFNIKCHDCEYWKPVCNDALYYARKWSEIVETELFNGIISYNRKQKLAKLLQCNPCLHIFSKKIHILHIS